MDPHVARIETDRRAARARAEALFVRLPEVTERLFGLGARRVVLFGSLATGAQPHRGTDIDLGVEGLDDSSLGEVALEFQALGVDLDLVRLEVASPGLRRRIEADGKELARVPG